MYLLMSEYSSATFTAQVDPTLSKLQAGELKQTIISTTAFNLDEGVAALQQVAMLKSISKSVPLSFNATFSQ
ncbi:MAG: hypothetical protein ACJAYN_002373 [Bermanella sp.]|jgi:hypothetical protein